MCEHRELISGTESRISLWSEVTASPSQPQPLSTCACVDYGLQPKVGKFHFHSKCSVSLGRSFVTYLPCTMTEQQMTFHISTWPCATPPHRTAAACPVDERVTAISDRDELILLPIKGGRCLPAAPHNHPLPSPPTSPSSPPFPYLSCAFF